MSVLDDLGIKEPEKEQKNDTLKKASKAGKALTEKMKSLIYWVGLICSIVSAVAYLIIVIVISVGFKGGVDFATNIAFAIITACIGLLISQFLKMQGVSFAKGEKEVKEVWEKFYARKSKKRKLRSLNYFWVRSIAFDILIKSVFTILICVGTAYIFVEASGDVARIFMAFFNLTLFAGFGMMSLTKAYDFTREEHVAWMQNQIDLQDGTNEAEKNTDETAP